MTKSAKSANRLLDLPPGTKIKLTDGFGETFAVVTCHVDDRWGHHCKVQIVASHIPDRVGELETIEGSETFLGIGWKVARFIKVNGEVRELADNGDHGVSADGTTYFLLGGSRVVWNPADRIWSLCCEDQRLGVVTVEW